MLQHTGIDHTPVDPFAAVRMSPEKRLSHAQGYLGLGMLVEAEAELAQLTGPDARTDEALEVLLAARQAREDWPAVRDIARELTQRDKAGPGAWIMLAYATRRANSLVAAEVLLLKAEKLFPGEATIQFNLGCYACQRGDLAEARRRVDRAIALDENFASAAATDPDLAPLRAADARPAA